MDALEGDLSFCVAGVSTIVIGSFDGGWGLPVFILMLLLALKYMEGSLFHFPFFFGDVLRVANTAAASLAKISGNFSFCCPVSKLCVESLVLTVVWLPIEMVFWLPVGTVFTVLVCLARGAFPFNFAMVALGVSSLSWTFSVLSALICNRFTLGVCAFLPPTVLGSAAWPFPLVLSVVVCPGFPYPWLSLLPQCAPFLHYWMK